MAISSDKLLNRPSELHRRYGGRLAMQEAQQQKMIGGGPSNVVLTKKSVKDIASIKVNVIKIESILKGTLAAEKKALDNKKRQESGKRREKQEEKLETKPQAQKGRIKVPSLPRMGFLDWVKNFIGNVILGYFALRMLEYLPKIKPIIKFIGSSADFLIGAGGNLLNGLASFIDWGYKAVDATNGFIKKIGGQGAVDNFGKFIGLIDSALFLTTTLAASMAVEALTSDSGGPGGGITRPGTGGRPRVTTSGGGAAGRPDIRNPFRQRPTVTTGGKPQFRLPGTRPSITGSGAKGVLSSVRPFLKRIPLPVVGALIDFGLSVALGEDPGRAAFKSIGAGILGGVGAALGGPFAILTGLAGGMLGDWAGGALYDMFFGGKKPQQNNKKIQGKAGGGITRGGKAQTGARRTIGGNRKRGKYKRVLKQEPQKTQFKTDPKKEPAVNTAKKLDETKYFGPILSAANKLNLKEELTQRDYKNVGLGLNSLLAKGIEDGQLKGGLVAAFAEGGLVDDKFLEATEKGTDLSGWISKTFQSVFETNAQKTLRLIRENAEKKPLVEELKAPSFDEPIYEGVPGGGLTPGQWGPMLDLISSGEGGYVSVNPSLRRPEILNMNLSQLIEFQKVSIKRDGGSAALGRYQFINPQLAYKLAGLDPKEKFTPANQDKMAVGYLEKKRPGKEWLAGKITTREYIEDLSREWGAFRSYTGYVLPGNSGKIGPEKIEAALKKVKKGGYSPQEIASSKERGVSGSGKFNIIEYITGDRNHPNFELKRHGLPSNYHDHIAFKTIEEKERAKRTLIGAGIKIGSELRPGDIGYHGRNLAIDIPGYQWGGRGEIGEKEFAGSRKVRNILGIGAKVSAFHGENFGIVPKGGMRLTLHEGEMYKVIDKDSVKLLGYDLTKDIIDIENRAQLVAKAPSIIQRLKAISGYADYEHPYGGEMSTQVIVVEKVVPQRIDSGSSILISSGGSRNRFNELYGSK